MAWFPSIVGQAAKATYIRVRNNFASLRIVGDGSGAVFRIVASSEIKNVELDVQ